MRARPLILVVDDLPQNRELLEAHLQPHGYDVAMAASGEEALIKAADDPDLILLDIMMPAMSGFDVLRALRAAETTRMIPVVMVTALKETEDRVRALESGCDDFISKPFEKTELLARVKSLLRISYYRRQLDEKEQLAAVIREMSDGVIIVGRDWQVVAINPSARRSLDIPESGGGDLMDTFFNKHTVSISREELQDHSNPHRIYDVIREESETTKASCLEVHQDVLRDPVGEVVHVVLTLRDVTATRREESLKQDFLGLISHKLRTPLAIMDGHLSLLLDEVQGPLTAKQRKTVESISRASVALGTWVEKILGFGLANGGGCERGTLDVSGELNALRTSVVGARKVEWSIDCPPDTKIHMNRMCFMLIMKNLVENAIKFNDKEVARISITTRPLSQGIEIAVTDNGVGLPGDEYKHIFESFYQVEKHFTGNVAGAGLGLSLVKKLVERRGGHIGVQSKLGEGSTFTFTL